MSLLETVSSKLRPRTRTVVRWLSICLLLAVLIAVGKFLYEHRYVFVELSRVQAYAWILPATLYSGTLLAKGLTFDILCRVYGVSISVRDSVALAIWGMLSNFALPGNTSLFFRTLYLQQVHGLSYRQFLPISAASFVFATGLYCLWAGVAAFIASDNRTVIVGVAIPLMGAGILLMVALQIPYARIARFGLFFEQLLFGWRRLTSSPPLFGAWLVLQVVEASLEIFLFYSIVRIMNFDVSFSQCVVVVLVKECSLILRITPGAIGVSEGVLALMGMAMGISPVQLVFVGLVVRLVELICLLLGFGLFRRRLIIQFKSASSKMQI
jgi:uncharacterized membrane protein YbhN (UPF0104 family)